MPSQKIYEGLPATPPTAPTRQQPETRFMRNLNTGLVSAYIEGEFKRGGWELITPEQAVDTPERSADVTAAPPPVTIVTEEPVDLNTMSAIELRAYAAQRGQKFSRSTTRQEMLSVLSAGQVSRADDLTTDPAEPPEGGDLDELEQSGEV